MSDNMSPDLAEAPILVSNPSQSIRMITFNRPKSLNAINIALLHGLVDSLRTAQAERKRVIVLEGAGERSFCSGEDLKETLAPTSGSADELRDAFERLQDITRLLALSKALVIAAVQGYAIGGGAEIALAADFVIGGPGAKFRFPEAAIGHAATGGITLRLPQMVGMLKAKELLLLGKFVDAEEALRIGLLSELVEDPKARALELACELEKLPAMSTMTSKATLERAVFPNIEPNLADEVNVASYCFSQSDAAKAYQNFARRGRESDQVQSQKFDRLKQNFNQPSQGSPKLADDATKLFFRPLKDINTAFEKAVRLFGDRTLLRFGSNDYSFQVVDQSVSKLAGGFANRGINRGDRVLVMMRNSVEMVQSWLAANRIGAVWVPINVELNSVTLQHVVDSANTELMIVDSEFVEVVGALQLNNRCQLYINGSVGPSSMSSLYENGSPVVSAVPVKPSDVAAFLYTSGTTGKSKPCALSHQYFILQGAALTETFGLLQDDILFCPFPLFHVDATALTTIPAILLGAIAAFSKRFSASRFWDQVREANATVYDFMGATLAFTYKQPPSDRDRDHNVRFAWGVPIPGFVDDYERRFGHPLRTLYGSVEAGIPVIQQGPRVAGSCGTLRPGYELQIVDDDDEAVAPNTPGQLLLRSTCSNAFFQGYFWEPEATLQAFSNLWLHTGDLAICDEKGNVHFVGRLKDVIRRRGENVNTCEVEEEFLRHPDVAIAAVFAIPSQLGSGTEEDLKLAVQLLDGSTTDENGLFDWAVKNMARFQVPTVIEIVPILKKTPTGKLKKWNLESSGGRRFDIRRP